MIDAGATAPVAAVPGIRLQVDLQLKRRMNNSEDPGMMPM